MSRELATSYREYHPNQGLLLPGDLREWLPEGHLAWHVSEMVDGLNLAAFHAPYGGSDGRRNQPYDPRMMVKVLVYAYATGTFSSRKIAAKLEEDVAYRVLGAGNFPAHRTICEFRRRHLEDFRGLFVEVALLERARGVDEKYGPEGRGDECPEKLRDRRALRRARARLAERRREVSGDNRDEEASRAAESEVGRLERLKAVVEARENVERDHAERTEAARERNAEAGGRRVRGPRRVQQGNTTDADSRMMKTAREGYQQCYNGQLAVDVEHQVIVAAELVNNASDQGVLTELVEGLGQAAGWRPREVLADGGYCNKDDLAELEAPNGWIKRVLGFRQFSVRGLGAARGEWSLVCMALNLRRLQGLIASAAAAG